MIESLVNLLAPRIEAIAMAVFFPVFVIVALRTLHFYFIAGRVEELENIGVVCGISVDILVDSSGKRWVGILANVGRGTVRGCLAPADALRLAQMLRIAASPGRNLVQARWNARRGSAANAALTG